MKLVSFLNNGKEKVGFLLNNRVFSLRDLHPWIPETMSGFLENWEENMTLAHYAEKNLVANPELQKSGMMLRSVELLAPVPHPGSLRDGYAFRQHVLTARRNRGLDMTSVFDEFPVFYFGNHRTVRGPGAILCMPDHLEQLDFELEVGIVICRPGKNIKAAEADEYIGGLMILNDFSARKLQMEEMQLSLGPAKGKDFATATGPWLVTLDELADYVCPPKPGHVGKTWNLNMIARIDDSLVSAGKLSDMDWTFAELIERASYGVDLYPGDIIGSGTVGTGCMLEINGSLKLADPDYIAQWLQVGETVELEVTGLGVLKNNIETADENYSILDLKKTSQTA